MKIDVKIDFTKAHRLIRQLSGPEFREATAKALTDAGFEARKVAQQEIDRSFDRPTPYIRRSIQVAKATADKLTATVEPTYMGGKGVDPQNIVRHNVFGGTRTVKASERALQRIGILQPGYSLVPGSACPLDAYGNIPRGFMKQLLTYFQALSEVGYKANMTAKRKAKLANMGRSERGYKTINGVVYFVSWGKLRDNGTRHLHYGIWSKTGIHGATVKPVLIFVRTPAYGARLDFEGRPVQAALDKFNPRLRYHMRTIIEGRP